MTHEEFVERFEKLCGPELEWLVGRMSQFHPKHSKQRTEAVTVMLGEMFKPGFAQFMCTDYEDALKQVDAHLHPDNLRELKSE